MLGRSFRSISLHTSSGRHQDSLATKQLVENRRIGNSIGQIGVRVARFLVIGMRDRKNTIRNSVDPRKHEEVAVFAAALLLRMRMLIL